MQFIKSSRSPLARSTQTHPPSCQSEFQKRTEQDFVQEVKEVHYFNLSHPTMPLPQHFHRSSLSRTDIKGILEEQAPQQVGPETIKAFYVKANVFEEVDTFYPHEAVLYMRFRPDQLSRLKKCQLQVSFTNEAEREVLHQYQ